MKPEPQQELARGFVLQGFGRATEELKIELHVQPVPLDRLRSLFDVGDDREMHDAYPLDAATAGVLSPLASEPIDTEKYEFFLQRYAQRARHQVGWSFAQPTMATRAACQGACG